MDKLQRAGRDFLMRLVAKHGLAGAARVLRALADELGGFVLRQLKTLAKRTRRRNVPNRAPATTHSGTLPITSGSGAFTPISASSTPPTGCSGIGVSMLEMSA